MFKPTKNLHKKRELTKLAGRGVINATTNLSFETVMKLPHCLSAVTVAVSMLVSPKLNAADAPHKPLRLVLVGDSTVCNYPEASPQRGWGQFIQDYFKEDEVRV